MYVTQHSSKDGFMWTHIWEHMVTGDRQRLLEPLACKLENNVTGEIQHGTVGRRLGHRLLARKTRLSQTKWTLVLPRGIPFAVFSF